MWILGLKRLKTVVRHEINKLRNHQQSLWTNKIKRKSQIRENIQLK